MSSSAGLRHLFLNSFLLLCLLGSSGCHVKYIDPYSGEHDEDRSFRSQGMIASISSLFIAGGKKPQKNALTPVSQVGEPLQVAWPCAPDHLIDWALLDNLFADLQGAFAATDLQILRADERILVLVPRHWFMTQQAYPAVDYYSVLDGLSAKWGNYPGIKVELLGLMDPQITPTVAQARAVHIEHYFNKNGVAPHRTQVRQPVHQAQWHAFAMAMVVCSLPADQPKATSPPSLFKRALFD